MSEDACPGCLRRAWLVGAMGGHLEIAHRRRDGLMEALALSDVALLELARSRRQLALADAYAHFSAQEARDRSRAAGLDAVCRHAAGYPASLSALYRPPAVLHTVGHHARATTALSAPTAAIVGSRTPSPYGVEVAHALARGLGAAGVTVVSGLATGIDAAAHTGALAGGGCTVAVLAGGADSPYPARNRTLYERVVDSGAVVSEMPAGYRAFRWCFLARNRVIAALSHAVIVVEASATSGSLFTARLARECNRRVGAVPGRVTSRMAAGPLELLRAGATVVRDAGDALELVCGDAPPPAVPGAGPRHAGLAPELSQLLGDISDGIDTAEQLLARGHPPALVARGLGELELLGHVRRTLTGGYTVLP